MPSSPTPRRRRAAAAPSADIFDTSPPPQPQGAASLLVQPSAAPVQSAAAKAFNRELARIDRIKKQLAEMEHVCRAHQQAWAQAYLPLEVELRACQRQMVHTLDHWLGMPAKTLSKVQRETALHILCSLTAGFAQDGDAEMAVLHDRHSPQTLAEKRQEHEEEGERRRAAFVDAWAGELPEGIDLNDPDALLHAAINRLKTEAEEEQAARQAQKAARQAKRKPTAAQQKAAQAQQDAETTLRTLYRQLASALHPDREPDEQERQRKTALMSQANAAYDRKDLVALLTLQLEAELVDPQHLERVSEDRLKSLTLLLKQQVAELERERQMQQQRWEHEFQLPWGGNLSSAYLGGRLTAWCDELRADLDSQQYDLTLVADLITLKPWLNEQRKLQRRIEKQQYAFILPGFI